MTRTAEQIAADIRSWDMQEVTALRDMIAELSACRDHNGQPIDTQDYIDMTALPSAEIPDHVDTSYPVWAVDLLGYALVGDGADRIEHLDEVQI